MTAKLIALVLPLGLDTFAVAAAIGMIGVRTIALGISISLDELAIGFTLGLLHISAVLVIALIAVQTLIVTQLGLRLGNRLGERIREGAERLAGVALTTLGIILMAEKLLARPGGARGHRRTPVLEASWRTSNPRIGGPTSSRSRPWFHASEDLGCRRLGASLRARRVPFESHSASGRPGFASRASRGCLVIRR
jgi:hypothetical protein